LLRFFETCCDFREIGMPLSGKPPDSEAYALSRLNKVGKSEFRSVHVLFLCRYFARMHEYRFDETNHLRGASENRGSVIPGRHQNGEPGIHNPRPMVMDSGSPLSISGLPEIGTIRCAHRQQPMCGGEPE